MTKQSALASVVVRLFLFATVLFIGMQTATAKQCSVAAPSKLQGHWSYRLIDGRKCWYEGQNNLSRSLLSWSAETSSPDKAVPRLEKEGLPPENEVMNAMPSNAPDHNVCCGTMIETPYTFEARWQDLLPHD
jgi:hypothetical protein